MSIENKNLNFRYSFDQFGFYSGLYRRVGDEAWPPNTTWVEPIFDEPYRTRWNSKTEEWYLVPRAYADTIVLVDNLRLESCRALSEICEENRKSYEAVSLLNEGLRQDLILMNNRIDEIFLTLNILKKQASDHEFNSSLATISLTELCIAARERSFLSVVAKFFKGLINIFR